MSEANAQSQQLDKLIAAVEETGAFTRACELIGVAENTMRTRVKNAGRWGEVKEARERYKANKAEKMREQAETGDAEVSELEVLRHRNKELETALRARRKDDVLEERIVTRTLEAIAAKETRYSPLVIPKKGKLDALDEHEFLLLFSDAHAGEIVDLESTLGMNEYNWDIMLRRMNKIQRSVLSYQENRPYPIRKLNIGILGDQLSGDIHEELSITNDRTVEEAVVQLSYDTASWIEGFIPHFETIQVTGVPGNHPRRSKKPQAKLSQNNADWLHYNFTQAVLQKYDNIAWHFPRSDFALMTLAQQWRVLLMHGDGIRTTMPGVPWGGVIRRITVLEQQFNKAKMPIDYVCLGHFHTANALDGVGVKTFLNGTIKGLDEYSLKQFGSGRAPTQVLLTFHPRNGVTDVSYIDLEPVVPNAAPAIEAVEAI